MDYHLFSGRKYTGYWKLDGSDPDIRSVYHADLEFQMQLQERERTRKEFEKL